MCLRGVWIGVFSSFAFGVPIGRYDEALALTAAENAGQGSMNRHYYFASPC